MKTNHHDGLILKPDDSGSRLVLDGYGDIDEQVIISIKEARKILGKTLSEQLSDEYLTDIIRQFSYLSKAILYSASVPQDNKMI